MAESLRREAARDWVRRPWLPGRWSFWPRPVPCARQAGDHEGSDYRSGLVDEMIWRAVQARLDHFQREVGYTRNGSRNSRAHGRETGQWHEAELAVAHWLQHTSRASDMKLHVHSQIAHTAKTATGGK